MKSRKESALLIIINHFYILILSNLLHFKFEDLDLIKTIGTGTFGRVLLCKSKVNLEDIVNHEVGWGRVCKSSSFFCHVS